MIAMDILLGTLFPTFTDQELRCSEPFAELHSSGTVWDFHPIPFSFPDRIGAGKPNLVVKIEVNSEKQCAIVIFYSHGSDYSLRRNSIKNRYE